MTDSPVAYEGQVKSGENELENAQQEFLKDRYFGIVSNRFDRESSFSLNRQIKILEYEQMEFMPEIARALDIFAEESCVRDENGNVVTITAKDSRILKSLEELFYNRLKIESQLFYWVRGLCKYGDLFFYRYVEKGKGIVALQQLPSLDVNIDYEISQKDERIKLKRFVLQNFQGITKSTSIDVSTDYTPLEVAHMKMVGDNKYAPYGTSIIDSATKIHNQLRLAEDCMLVYRATRAPERRVFKIDVGNMDAADIDSYMDKMISKIKSDKAVNDRNGNVDLRSKTFTTDEDFFIPVRGDKASTVIDTLPGACLSLDTLIPLLDGRNLKLSEIIDIWDKGERDLWVYSINPISGEIVPGPITWAGVTKRDTEVVHITLDNGETITCTPDHKFPTRFNGEIEAKDLKEGESLWSFNLSHHKKRNNTYITVYDHSKKENVFVHRLIFEYNKTHNILDKIVFKEKYSEKMLSIISDYIKQGINQTQDILPLINNSTHEFYQEWYNLNRCITHNDLDKMVKTFGYNNWRHFKKKAHLFNHKVVKVEYLAEKQDTGTITVDGNEVYHNYHNFALMGGVFTKNSNLSEISDVEYFQRKLFIALGVPKQYLGYDEAVGQGKNLAQEDIRFATLINRIQQSIIEGLNEMAMVHLTAQGIEFTENDFEITLSNPSTQTELLRLELNKGKAELFKSVTATEGTGIAQMSHTEAWQKIWGFSEQEMKQSLMQQRIERGVGAELEKTKELVKNTGYFDEVDKKFKDILSPEELANQQATPQQESFNLEKLLKKPFKSADLLIETLKTEEEKNIEGYKNEFNALNTSIQSILSETDDPISLERRLKTLFVEESTDS